MRKFFVLVLAATLALTMSAGVAQAKGKGSKGTPKGPKPAQLVTYTFTGTIYSVDTANSEVKVSVKSANKVAKTFVGKDVTFQETAQTQSIERNGAPATSADLQADDQVTVQAKAPRGQTTPSFVATKIIAESPQAYYFDADGDGIGAGQAEYYFAREEPEGCVSEGGDNCADVANADQLDTDGDLIGDACDEPATTV